MFSPVLTRVLGSATHEEVNTPLLPYQRIGRSVSLTPILPTSPFEVMYCGCTSLLGLASRSLTVGSASGVKRKGIGVRFLNEVSCPDGYAHGSSFDLKRSSTSGGGIIWCKPKTDDSKRLR